MPTMVITYSGTGNNDPANIVISPIGGKRSHFDAA